MAILKRPTFALLLLLAAAAVYWLWFGLTQRSFDIDETISLTAVQGILEHGIQRFPSGFLYGRGYVPHYLEAASARVFGFNQFAIILPSLVMGLGTLLLTYLFARDVLKKPWLGIVAAAILITLQLQTIYATSPRMYMALEFFTLLSIYSAWRGFVRDEKGFRFLAFLALSLAILSNRQAIVLVAAIPFSIMVAYWISERRILPNLNRLDLLGILLVGSVIYFMFGYEVPDAMPAIAHSGARDSRTGFALNPILWANHIYNGERSFPYALPLIFASALSVVALIRRERLREASGLIYCFALVSVAGAISALFLGLITGTRFWVFLLPIIALLVSVGGATLLELFGLSTRNGLLEKRRINMTAAILLFATGLFLSIGFGVLGRGAQFTELVKEGYGTPCRGTECDPRIRMAYDDLDGVISPDDIVLSTDPTITNYYVGRVDYLFRRKTEKVKVHLTEEYLGIPVADSTQELDGLLRGRERIWVVTHSELELLLEQDVRDFLESSFEKFVSNDLMIIYVSCLEIDPC